MRVFLLLASASVLASCGGAGSGVSSLASSAVGTPVGSVTPTPGATPTPSATPTPNATSTPTATPTATPTPTPTPGVTGTPSTVIPQPAAPTGTSMFDVTAPVTFKAIGGLHALDVTTKTVTDTSTNPPTTSTVIASSIYTGNASLPSTPSGTIAYDPRDAIFELNFADSKAGVTQTHRFQDPAHRVNYGGGRQPAGGVIALTNWNYLTSGNDTEETIFFYQRPGNKTNYVTLAGYYHHTGSGTNAREIRGAMTFGAPTPLTQVPRTGGGRYSGELLATMVGKNADDPKSGTTTFQWVKGDSTVDVDFAAATVAVQLAGTVGAGRNVLGEVLADDQILIRTGSTFNAAAAGKIDLAAGTFAGKFSTATFGSMNGTPLDFAAISPGSDVAGASSVDGAFYGPDAQEVGGSFRIVGGRPDQRVDVLGAFTGKK